MKKLLAIAMSLVLTAMLCVGLSSCGTAGDGEISVFYYTYSDTYISSVRSAMDKLLKGCRTHLQQLRRQRQPDHPDRAGLHGTGQGLVRLLIVNVVDTGSDDAAQSIVEHGQGKERSGHLLQPLGRRIRWFPATTSAYLSAPIMKWPAICRAK